ncbi:hypothetical protein C8R47DRAFT_1071687 [Mycena vitilis]|nr:hypothetical protein C8R47DRAFT_1071687 [Mycena vitilis]
MPVDAPPVDSDLRNGGWDAGWGSWGEGNGDGWGSGEGSGWGSADGWASAAPAVQGWGPGGWGTGDWGGTNPTNIPVGTNPWDLPLPEDTREPRRLRVPLAGHRRMGQTRPWRTLRLTRRRRPTS